MNQIEISQLTYQYPGTERAALQEVSLKISAGEFVGVIGANNSGKSTLCLAVTGVVPHLYHGSMQGEVLLNGQSSIHRTVSEIGLDAGLVLQMPVSQISGVRYTVFEEVAFGLENRGVAREEIRERVASVLNLLGLEPFASRSPFQLSGGQQQRLALATVLAVDPSIVVLDEPTTFLDPQGARLVFSILQQLQQQGKTIVIAEQRLDLVAEFAGRVLALDAGRLVLDGSPQEVLTAPLMQSVGLSKTRYTRVAELLRQRGVWPADLPLPASLTETVAGIKKARQRHDH